jgi:hypothetical protein
MGADLIVVLTPLRDDLPGVGEVAEPVLVQALIPETGAAFSPRIYISGILHASYPCDGSKVRLCRRPVFAHPLRPTAFQPDCIEAISL